MKKEKVNPWIAAGLNLVILGLGLAYLGKWFYAIIYWALIFVLYYSGNFSWTIAALLLIVCCAHSYYLAEKQNEAKK